MQQAPPQPPLPLQVTQPQHHAPAATPIDQAAVLAQSFAGPDRASTTPIPTVSGETEPHEATSPADEPAEQLQPRLPANFSDPERLAIKTALTADLIEEGGPTDDIAMQHVIQISLTEAAGTTGGTLGLQEPVCPSASGQSRSTPPPQIPKLPTVTMSESPLPEPGSPPAAGEPVLPADPAATPTPDR